MQSFTMLHSIINYLECITVHFLFFTNMHCNSLFIAKISQDNYYLNVFLQEILEGDTNMCGDKIKILYR